MQPRRKRILFLCDDATMREIRQMLFERVGYIVWSTDSMDEATTIAQMHRPDMLLMDSGYPTLDLEASATKVKNICPAIIAVVLAPYFAVRDTSRSTIDCFVARDQGPDLLLSQIAELLTETGTEDSRAKSVSAS